jgi:CRISPR-associated protein (TIGR02584 family)
MTQIKRKILVAVSGTSPQIITETMFGLIVGQPQPWIPDEIHLVTTISGKSYANLQLLEGHAHFLRFIEDYNIETPIAFSASNIHVIIDNAGNPLSDLRTTQENEAAADYITAKVLEWTADDATELHVSIAGGRKTMGYYMGYALALLGRPQDRLSHVLVSPEYEALPGFFYPTPTTRVLYKQVGNRQLPLDAANAVVTLAEIPFVRLRNLLADDALVNRHTFSELVALINQSTAPTRVDVNVNEKTLRVNGISCKLNPGNLAFYTWFAKRAKAALPGLPMPVEGECIETYRNEYIAVLRHVKGISVGTERTEFDTLAQGMDKKFFEQSISKIRRAIKQACGANLAERAGITRVGPRGQSVYKLALSPQQITIVE